MIIFEKKNFKLAILIIVAMAVVFALSTDDAHAASKKTKMSRKKVTVQAGTDFNLKVKNIKRVKIKDKYGNYKYTKKGKKKTKKPKVKWYSTNTKVAVVTAKGRVITIKKGKTTIVAKVGKKKYKCKVKVKRPTFVISSKSKPLRGKYRNYSTYNKYTRPYYTVRSYFEFLEVCGGGTIVFKKGTYNISNTIYVPSNVKVVFNSGTKINKRSKTGTSKMAPSRSLFQFCEPSKAAVANKFRKGKYKYGYTKYNGVHNVKFIGKGTVKIDTKYSDRTFAIVMSHNKNVTFKNIQFHNMNQAHFFELDASYKVTIDHCQFINGKGTYHEGINLDTPDLSTGGFNSPWTSFDKTANNSITIRHCTFKNLPRAIGTHNYSYGNPHVNTYLYKNTFLDTKRDVINIMYWNNTRIDGNTIRNVGSGFKGIRSRGCVNIDLRNNRFENLTTVMQLHSWKKNGAPVINSSLSKANINNITKGNNKYINVEEDYIELSTGWDNENDTADYTVKEIYKLFAD